MSFYLTLPSNASFNLFPGNNTNKYTTSLARSVDLDGSWEVALVEAVLPPLKITTMEELVIVYTPPTDVTMGSKVPYFKSVARNTVFSTPRDLITHVNTLSALHGDAKEQTPDFVLELMGRYLWVKVPQGASIQFFGRDFALLFGVQLKVAHQFATESLKFLLPEQLDYVYIYSDIAEHICIGDAMAPCVRVIPINRGNTEYTVVAFERPHYVPLLRNVFSTITVEFVNDVGEDIHFKFGMSLVKFHFRPRRH